MYLGSVVTHITAIINTSISRAILPSNPKLAMMIPSLKKPSLDINDLSSYRPVANLAFLSKIIERAIIEQLDSYLLIYGLYPPMQSVYRKFHSTGTVLIKIFNDISCALDEAKNAVLILLDLSCAFDTVDHNILSV